MADGEILFPGSIRGLYFFSSVFFLLLFFLPIAFAHSTTAQTKPRQSQYLRTTRTVEQPVIGPAQSNKVHTTAVVGAFVRVDPGAECGSTSQQTGKN